MAKRKGILDLIIEDLNESAIKNGREPHWKRLNSEVLMEKGDGRWRRLNGQYVKTKNKGEKNDSAKHKI